MHLNPDEPPTLIVLFTVCVYWTIVAAMVVRRRRRTRKLSGVVPEQRMEVWMGLLWIPLVAAWVALPALAVSRRSGAFALPAFATADAFTSLRWIAAAMAVVALHGSIRSWRQMGRHWTMAVTRDEAGTLFTGGMFARVRHPIYALSILLMLSTWVVVPNIPMLVVAAVHVALMHAKARNEERFLLDVHGDEYASYCERTGRFLPRLTAAQ
ncbi:MAG: isoprenylcysteine carboxylmethyltransferase family protein [Casimicrobiaceae bacterium]